MRFEVSACRKRYSPEFVCVRVVRPRTGHRVVCLELYRGADIEPQVSGLHFAPTMTIIFYDDRKTRQEPDNRRQRFALLSNSVPAQVAVRVPTRIVRRFISEWPPGTSDGGARLSHARSRARKHCDDTCSPPRVGNVGRHRDRDRWSRVVTAMDRWTRVL